MMKINSGYAAAIGLILISAIASSAGADPGRSEPLGGLSGRVFAVEAEILFSLDPSSPVGLVFENCYTFNEDGSWEDPLFPLGPFPGVWVQHTELPKILYTATVDDAFPGLLLIQNGTVHPSRGKGVQRLTAYTTVFDQGVPVVEVLSKGKAVESCPFDF